MPRKRSVTLDYPQKTVALCYIRQSYTRADEDTNSPQRQRARQRPKNLLDPVASPAS